MEKQALSIPLILLIGRRTSNVELSQAREAEERKEEDRNNPLKSAIETYALTGADVDVFIHHFAAMDVDRQGGSVSWVSEGMASLFPLKHRYNR